MERFLELLQDSNQKLRSADYILTQTYPVVEDPRLLLSIIQKVFSALEDSMTSLLYIERYYKRIPPFEDTFRAKFDIFRYKLVNDYNINREYLLLIKDIEEILRAQKNSPMTFSRKGKFVICTDNYRTREITFQGVKRYIEKSKDFFRTINRVVGKYGRI